MALETPDRDSMTTTTEFLRSVNAEAIVKEKRPLIQVKTTDSVPIVFDILVRNHVLSAPVWDGAASKWTGMVDLLDLLAVVVECFDQEVLEQYGIEYIIEQHLRFVSKTAKDVENLSKTNPLVTVRRGASLYDVMTAMQQQMVHRVAIVDENNQIVELVTQSSVIQYLNCALSQLGPGVFMPCGDSFCWEGEVLEVDQDAPAISAFISMSAMKMSAVAVVDSEQRFFSVLSARDIKLIGPYAEYFQKLYWSVRKYIAEVRLENRKTMYPAIGVHREDSLAKVIQKLAATRVHRLFMTDIDNKLSGVVALIDVISAVLGL